MYATTFQTSVTLSGVNSDQLFDDFSIVLYKFLIQKRKLIASEITSSDATKIPKK
jgi:hypothetical protein